MNGLNIKTIFDNNYKNEKEMEYKMSELNTSNICGNLTDKTIIEKLRISEQIEKKNNENLYNKKYSECLTKISNTIDIKKTDIFFEVNQSYFGYNKYNSMECLSYIQKKLRKNKFDTLIISPTIIFITWKNTKI